MNARWWHVSEFASHDGVQYPEAWMGRLEALCSQLDRIRGDWGGPLRVVSGYRSPEHNAKVGGAVGSWHMQGMAADIAPMVAPSMMSACVADLHGRIMRALMDHLPLIGGVGYYAGKWCHVDIRPKPHDGHIAQWTGTGLGAELV